MDVQDIRKLMNEVETQHDAIQYNLKNNKANRKRTTKKLQTLESTQKIIQTVSQSVQEKAHKQISGVVASCLESVFGDEYSFRIDFVPKRGRTEAQLVLVNQGQDVLDPLNEDSGGVADVASFALRIACIILAKPNVRKLVVLDEPFKFVSEEYRPAIIEMIERLSEDFDIQFIMVTHISDLQIGKVVRL